MQPIVGTLAAPAALDELVEGFLAARVQETAFWLPGRELPGDFRDLLDHHDHMTRRLGEYWGAPMTLEVLQVRRRGEDYRRMILLRPRGSDRVVEVGIARVWLAHIPPAAREEVDSQRAPLGEIFERHALLREVEPRAFARFLPDSPIVEYFGSEAPDDAYGRIATIACGGRPAVELLEVVRARESGGPGAT